MIRIDSYISPKLNGYFRWIRDEDVISDPFQGFNFVYTTTLHPVPGHGYAAHVTYSISPSTLNEFTLGKSWNSSRFELETPAAVARSLMGNIPQWFPNDVSSASKNELIDAACSRTSPSAARPSMPPA